MKGLLGRSSLAPEHALYLAPCDSIHTFFMKFNLDLIFLNKDMKVEKIVRNIAPHRMVYGGFNAKSVLETASGWFPENLLNKGDKVDLQIAECEMEGEAASR